MSEMRQALDGIRVVDLSNFLAGPMVSMYLGDFGAEVIKVERPDGGDECRLWGNQKDGIGLYFKVLNRNKKSITADLRTEIGVEIVKRLVQRADIVIENFRPGTLERWGLGYESLSKINPRIIMVRISGFGQTGPYRLRPGFGTLAEAFSGYAYITGFPDRPPLLPAFGLADATTGLNGAYLALAAMRARDQSGRGQVIDVAIYEPLYTLLGPQVIEHDQLGLIQERNGSRLPFTAPRNTFQTRDDKWVSISGSGQKIFERICIALGLPGLLDDPRFADNQQRIQNAEDLDRTLQTAIEKHDLTDLLELFDKHEATVAPVYDVAQTMVDPQFIARENVITVEDTELGPLRQQNVVGKLSATPGQIRWAGPRLGEHNREVVVDELGFDPEVLRAAGLAI